jgi:hypothetical protein
MENNALSFAQVELRRPTIVENSVFNHNSTGFAPNSENRSDSPPPQNGACVHKPYNPISKKLPKFTSTEVGRCAIIRNSRFEHNNLNTVER